VKRILVIRLGALGDFAQTFPAFAAVRAHHAADHVVLLTTPPFASLALESPWFDQVRVDTRPSWFNLPAMLRLRRQLRGFDFVYDLQTSRRSSRYYALAGRPPWSGIAAGCSHPQTNPRRGDLHTVPRHRDQLAVAGVTETPEPDVAWLAVQGLRLPVPYALLAPGTSGSHGGAKSWPLERYAALAGVLEERGVTPVVVGTAADAGAAAQLREAVPATVDLTGATSLQSLAGVAARAVVAIGGDTGPIHLAGVMGCPVVALFSRFSHPVTARPLGPSVVVQADTLADLPLERVVAALPEG
jgi:ADP-heptose:LPS heptosyltransferase